MAATTTPAARLMRRTCRLANQELVPGTGGGGEALCGCEAVLLSSIMEHLRKDQIALPKAAPELPFIIIRRLASSTDRFPALPGTLPAGFRPGRPASSAF